MLVAGCDGASGDQAMKLNGGGYALGVEENVSVLLMRTRLSVELEIG